MNKHSFVQQCDIHKVVTCDLRQQTKKIDINQANEIIFQLKLKIPQLLYDYRYTNTNDSWFYQWMQAIEHSQRNATINNSNENNNNNNNNNGDDDGMIILNYSTNNIFIGFNSLMLYYEKIRTIITDIFIVESDNIGIENSIIDILFKYISFDGVYDDNEDKKSN